MSVIEHCDFCGREIGDEPVTYQAWDQRTEHTNCHAMRLQAELVELRQQLQGAVEALERIAEGAENVVVGGETVMDAQWVAGVARNALNLLGGQSDQIKTSRTDALNVACPRCAAAPGEPCTGARGKVRESMHRERHQALQSGK
jgi:hypothetical protein